MLKAYVCNYHVWNKDLKLMINLTWVCFPTLCSQTNQQNKKQKIETSNEKNGKQYRPALYGLVELSHWGHLLHKNVE